MIELELRPINNQNLNAFPFTESLNVGNAYRKGLTKREYVSITILNSLIIKDSGILSNNEIISMIDLSISIADQLLIKLK